ncbi:unnamed protein product [Brassicogethes aeneus]|uniref:Gamma-tubulin complex component n=1 Tax=Brassicogethes aeneus TaxID=1431903 RepID=A0A9P0B7S5_BRAAE|nr:unnamed protein product [Brassicogethes aeneus]
MTSTSETLSISESVLALCNHLGKNDDSTVSSLYKLAFTFLSTSQSSTVTSDEAFLISQIKELLSEQNPEYLEKFDLLYNNICKSNILKQRPATLRFLLNLAKSQNDCPKFTLLQGLEKVNSQTNVSSKRSNFLSTVRSQESLKDILDVRDIKKYSSVQSSTTRFMSSQATTVSSQEVWSREYLSGKPLSLSPVTESELLQDVIYSLQGIESKYLRKEVGGLGFAVDFKVGKNLTPIQKGLVDRLLGTSFFHGQLKQYCDENDKQSGIICQSLVSTLREELSAYYKTIALLQANMKSSDMSLRRAIFILYDHHAKFEWLAYIAEQCSDKKGGALISAIHGFLQHGSRCAQEVSEKVLTAVCKPLYIMLSRWLLDGEINDPCNEFFIEIKSISSAEELWDNKYFVRKPMVPSFITMNQANKILATGKSINFLRQICKDGGQLPGRESLQRLFKNTSAEALFATGQNIEFHTTLENVYRETSLRVLDLLKNKFRLYEHLQSLRRYLLLGQGDFIRHLLELLVPELCKNANEIYGHTLSAILESAIRVTNAQFEDEDTLKRLTVSFGGCSHGDKGWDVFSLCYIIDGPVGSIFQTTMSTYKSLFGALWKAKRMEFVLANMRKQQITIAKLFKKVKELKPVMHKIHVLTSEMIHFLHQTQYYFLFEVLECSWAEMLNQVNKAESLDDIINAHRTFLGSVKKGVLLDPEYREIFNALNSIYTLVLEFETYQSSLYAAAEEEHAAICDYEMLAENPEDFGVNNEYEITANARKAAFQTFVKSTKYNVNVVSDRYTNCVHRYLRLLSSSSNMNLQLLSVRLSFNDFYKVT